MHRNHALAIALVLFSLLWVADAPAQYKVLETGDLRLIYNDLLHGYLAPHAARCFHNSMEFYRKVFQYEPSEKVTIIIDDASDYNNAGVSTAPRNFMLVQIAPNNTVYETLPGNESMNHTMNHEVMHVVAMDQSTGRDSFFRGLFLGKVREEADHPETILYSYLTTPRRSAPRWYHEGVAVFLETWLAGGIGRAQGPYDEMVFRSMVLDDAHFYDSLGLQSEAVKVDFQVGMNAYLYGARFVSYVAQTYGPEQVVQWISRLEGSKSSYGSQFKQVFGRSLDDTWSEWIEWEKEFQAENIRAIRTYDVTPYDDVSQRALGSLSRSFYDSESDELYVALNYPGVVSHIAAISMRDGSMRRLQDVKGPALHFVTSLAYDAEARLLFYTADNYEWRDIYSLDPQSGESKLLMKDVRIGDIVVNPADRSLWGVRHYNGIATLVRIPPPYDDWNQIHSFPYGQVLYDLDISPDGQRLSFSLGEISGRQTLRMASLDDLRAGTIEPETIFDFGESLPANFVFSPEGEYLFGSSYYTGVSNIWRYDVAADSMEVVSNAETGFFRPMPLPDESLLVYRYTGGGFLPTRIDPKPLTDLAAISFLGAEIAEEHPVVRRWNAGSPARVDLDALKTHEGPYRAFGSMELLSAYPVVEGYKDYAAGGIHLSLADPAYFNGADLTVSYTPTRNLASDERLHAKLKLRRQSVTLTGRYNAASFYDLFGPTKSSRRGYSVGLEYRKTLIHDSPKRMDFVISTAGHGDLEKLPDAQNVSASFDRLWSSSASLTYSSKRRSIGSIDHEKGYEWGLEVGNNYVNRRAFPSALGTLDFGVPVAPFKNSSVWIRTAGGFAPGDREEPFANFFFGGFGNNWVDHLSSERYRQYYSFPGLELNEVGGRNFGKAMLEFNLPPLRFRRLGIPSFYVTWARTSLFTTGLVTNLESDELRRRLGNAGAQMDLRFTLLSRLKMTVSLGYAFAFERDRRRSTEFMFSLKVL